MKNIFLLLVLGVAGLSCRQNKSGENADGAGGSGSIQGVISFTEKDNASPDAGATVYAVSTTRQNPAATGKDTFKNIYFSTQANANGNYTLPDLPADTYTLVFQSRNAPKKLIYYKSRYKPALEPLINDLPDNNISGANAKAARLNGFFQDLQVSVKPDTKLQGGKTQVVNQEFIKG
ncbi:MAG: hypothetical protein COW65_02110 [Cytophagales bacterium CG18_big_fil_WC_8_21_14_2_50_42_9]|nr:MAG: hypothetical protein COW65_02110 [Cytophagales bacterium CG18_big_fil_WC_8_21_14_2_50_42_9]